MNREAKLHVLVVDDNITNRLITTQLLEQKHGIDAVTANNGREAIQVLQQLEYDLVIMDCMMPEMDGYEATRAIRDGQAGAQNRDVPIIALTANAMEGDRELCLESGMTDYLSKPIRPRELSAALKRWINASHPTTCESEDLDTAASDSFEDKSPPATTDLFDISHMEEMYEGDQTVIDSLLSFFLENLDECLAELQSAYSEGTDTDRVRFHAHQIRGSAANYGAKSLQKIMTEMETYCVYGQLDKALQLYPKASQIAHETIEAIEAIRDPVKR